MLLYRSLSVGLLGAVLYFVVADTSSVPTARTLDPGEPVQCARQPSPDVTIVDVARGVEPAMIASLVKVHAGERIAKVDGTRVESDIAGGAELGFRARGVRRFIDVEIAGVDGDLRRVLVLLH